MFYHAVDRKKNEVELILKEEHVSNVLEVQRESDRSLKLKNGRADVESRPCICPTDWISIKRKKNSGVSWMK